MGGHQVPGMGSGDDGYDEEGYDESQRAEILEATRNGPTDGLILTDLDPDLGELADGEGDEAIDDLDSDAEAVGKVDDDATLDADDSDEDDVQDDFDTDALGDDADLDDADDAALKP